MARFDEGIENFSWCHPPHHPKALCFCPHEYHSTQRIRKYRRGKHLGLSRGNDGFCYGCNDYPTVLWRRPDWLGDRYGYHCGLIVGAALQVVAIVRLLTTKGKIRCGIVFSVQEYVPALDSYLITTCFL